MTDQKFLKHLDKFYEEGNLYNYITEFKVGDNKYINSVRVSLLFERLYSRIEQLESEIETLNYNLGK
jgi:hypothetical protein